MKTKILIATAILLQLFIQKSFAQYNHLYPSTEGLPYDYIPEEFYLNEAELRDHIYNAAPSYYRSGKYARMNYRYADVEAKYIIETLTSGDVYTDWKELEDYVNKVLQNVIPEELKKDEMIHAYILKDGSNSTTMTSAGIIFINIGVFEEVRDEATLAAVLAHGLAHYYKHHYLEDFISEELGDYDYGMLENNEQSKQAILSEYEADSISMVWMKNSKYHIGGLLDYYRIIERAEKRAISRLANLWKLEETTHPTSAKRLERFGEFYEKNKENAGNRYLVSEEKFNQMREYAKAEILYHKVNNFKLASCIESAFHFHLLDPDNPIYVYYLLESIRRQCYKNAFMWSKNFITTRYYESYIVKGKRHKKRVKRHLFEKMDLNILPVSPKELSKIKARFYWTGEPKFRTYEEAFVFFYALGKKLGCKECILSNALSIVENEEIRNKYLKEYIQLEGVKHKDFAQRMIDDKVYEQFNDKKLTVVFDFDVYVKEGIEPIYLTNKNNLQPQREIMDRVGELFPEREIIFLSDLRKSDPEAFIQLNHIYYNAGGVTFNRTIKPKLHVFDPNYLDMFKKFNVSEIEFITLELWETRKKETTVEQYKETIKETHDQILSNTKTTRSITLEISTVREKRESAMIVGAYLSDEILKFKESAYDQIVNYIRISMNDQDKYAKEDDIEYRNN